MDISKWCQENNYSLRQYFMEDYKKHWIQYTSVLPGALEDLLYNRYGTKWDKYRILDECNDEEPWFVFVIPSYNNSRYVRINLESIFRQRYSNYRIIYMDDCSQDATYRLAKKLISDRGMDNRSLVIGSKMRSYQSGNRFMAYHLCDSDEILCMLDGDDWLANPNVLNILSDYYKSGCLTSYGSHCMYGGQKGLFGNELFPREVMETRQFRNYRWTSGHLRTGYAGLFQRLHLSDFLDESGQFIHCCTDLCEMYGVLEMSSPSIACVTELVYIYNRLASNQYRNSYYNQGKYPLEKMYRDYVMTKLQSIPKYPNIKIEGLFQQRIQEIDRSIYIIDEDIKDLEIYLSLMEICGIAFLGKQLELQRVFLWYPIGIEMGQGNNISGKFIIRKKGSIYKKNDRVLSIK